MIGDAVKYAIKIIRDHEFVIVIDAENKADAFAKVMRTAIDCDAIDQKETKIVRISEASSDVLNPYS
jgi:hypothetical protein